MLRSVAIAFGCLLALTISASTAVAQPKPLKAPFTKEEAKAAQEAWAKHLGKKVEEEIDIGGGLKMVFELIPPGTFMMGSPDSELKLDGDAKAYEDEMPCHDVTIAMPFYLGKNVVTQAEYVQLTGKPNPSYFCGRNVEVLNTSRFPVEQVSWDEAVAYASSLKNKLGKGWVKARLPSEAMWEYACRAGTDTPWNAGSRFTEADVNGEYNWRTHAVGTGVENAFGLCDINRNVCQWCTDWYQKYPATAQTNPEGPDTGSGRLARGGSYLDSARMYRSAHRLWFAPSSRFMHLGFRLALVPSGRDK
jgi:formylglycine-generating enzyme required for sulfatase activity